MVGDNYRRNNWGGDINSRFCRFSYNCTFIKKWSRLNANGRICFNAHDGGNCDHAGGNEIFRAEIDNLSKFLGLSLFIFSGLGLRNGGEMIQFIKRYKFFFITLLPMVLIAFLDWPKEVKALHVLYFSLKEMLLVIPPIFLLLGFLDVWVPKETMTRYMGSESGMKGMILAFFIGSAAAGPLYGAFPVAAVLMKKGASFTNILIFIGAWSTTKIPMLLFEMAALGSKFAWTRLAVDIPGIIIIAWILNRMISNKEKAAIYRNADNL